MPTVRDIMTPKNKLIIFKPNDPVRDALDAIREHDIHGVLVYPNVEEGEASWMIFTSSDLVRFMASGESDITPMHQVASPVLYSASSDWEVKECWKRMDKYHVEHFPVLETSGELIGILSVRDLQKHL